MTAGLVALVNDRNCGLRSTDFFSPRAFTTEPALASLAEYGYLNDLCSLREKR